MNMNDDAPFGVLRVPHNQYYFHYFRRVNRKGNSRMFKKNRRRGK